MPLPLPQYQSDGCIAFASDVEGMSFLKSGLTLLKCRCDVHFEENKFKTTY
jgi:hypothetical protein